MVTDMHCLVRSELLKSDPPSDSEGLNVNKFAYLGSCAPIFLIRAEECAERFAYA
jgi:hypothetical protein